jgi:malonyl-CoA decarboxylase
MRMVFLASLLEVAIERGRRFFDLDGSTRTRLLDADALTASAESLLTSRGEASLIAIARATLDAYLAAPLTIRMQFLRHLAEHLGPDARQLDAALAYYVENRSAATAHALHEAAEPRRQELIRRLNLAAGGTHDLIRMREDVIVGMEHQEPLQALDADFVHLFSSWFNCGFLMLHRVDWSTPAKILEKIIQYEAVHEILNWDDLRSRLEPPDRRCFAFFHPRMLDEPLIFVEVALTRTMPAAVAPLLDQSRVPIVPSETTTAIFYSISNCQAGLARVSFGHFLIKQVVEELRREFPNLKTFATLSPVPGFMDWLDRERRTENSGFLSADDRRVLELVDLPSAVLQPNLSDDVRRVLTAAAAAYFLLAKTPQGRPVDPVARFHLGNGARLERINWLGDHSPKAVRKSAGLMVNYLYDLETIVENHEAFANHGTVVASAGVKKLLSADVKRLFGSSLRPQSLLPKLTGPAADAPQRP